MDDQKKRYFIARPTKTRKTYVLVCYIPIDRRKREYVPLDEKIKVSVDKINEHYLIGLIKPHEVEVLLKDLIQTQYRKLNVRNMVLKHSVISEINQKIFNQFWEKVYGLRYLQDEYSAQCDILKSIRMIEPLCIQTASALELQTQLKKSSKVREIRRASDRLNQLLRFLGRDFVLQKPKEGMHSVQYVTKPELDKILSFISDTTVQDMAVTLFCSGLRISEALALTEGDLVDASLTVNKQLTNKGELKLPKRDKVGRAVVIPFGLAHVVRWIEVTDKQKYRYRLYDELLDACQKAFPKNPSKWVGPHDLRHSHAIYLLGRGANLTQVAFNLRNRVDVCQKYYTGYAHSEGSADVLRRMLKE